MVDHHVDRPEVEASQGVELTGTNRSEILTKVLVTLEVQLSDAHRSSSGSRAHRDQISGADSGGVPPVPIPNTAVKTASADGSRTAGSLESRTVPD